MAKIDEVLGTEVTKQWPSGEPIDIAKCMAVLDSWNPRRSECKTIARRALAELAVHRPVASVE